VKKDCVWCAFWEGRGEGRGGGFAGGGDLQRGGKKQEERGVRTNLKRTSSFLIHKRKKEKEEDGQGIGRGGVGV